MKRFLKYTLLTIILGVFWGESKSQHHIGNLMVSNKFRGDQYFLDLYYEKAIDYYKLALKKDQNKEDLKIRIGDCYRLLRDYERAVFWYAQVIENDPDGHEPIYKYHYANMLESSGEYDEAIKWFEAYQLEVPEDSRTSRKLYGLNNRLDYYLDNSITEIDLLPFNTSYSETFPIAYKNELIFLSARENLSIVDEDYLRKEDLYDIYVTSYDSLSGWKESRLFDKVLNSPFHEGPVSFFNNQDKLLLTRSNYYNNRQTKGVDGKTRLQIYTVEKTGNIWANIQPFELNNSAYSIAHPAINMTNDTLFFVSDMPGGLGGTDIYMSVLNDRWSEPTNLGPKVNTEGDELFPYYTSDRLFFSSNGHDGIGGLDIYKAALDGAEPVYVVNLGSPINSPMDDFSYSIDPQRKSGFFSSTREGGIGSDDIYSFKQTAQVLQGYAIQEQDRSPLQGVQISLMQNDLLIANILTGSDGYFKFILPVSSDFQITAEKAEHSFKTDLTITTRGSRVDIDTLMIEMHKHDFFAQGLIYDSETQAAMHDARVIIKDESTQKLDTVLTGLDGLYSFVIEPGKDYLIRAEKDRFTSDSVRINTYSIGKGTILNDFLLDEEFIEKKFIFFDYNEVNIRADDVPALQQVNDILKRYPDDWLIIGAHADARGTKEYNQELSERRAQAVVDYFVARGVPRNKIIARGFGEGLIINRCSDGINCHEEDHSKNRRAEIVVEEKLPEEELENKGF